MWSVWLTSIIIHHSTVHWQVAYFEINHSLAVKYLFYDIQRETSDPVCHSKQ